ncbi:MAG: hypothetical protein FWF84_00630, partial [Kiritimatiellaeota bacterium]|nr:hypothetical protein [Kiritimatiellota bacterium]
MDGNPNTECWNIGVGCSLAMSENFTLDASLRHFQSGALKYSTTRGDDWNGYYTTDYSFKLNSNTFLVGVRYIF